MPKKNAAGDQYLVLNEAAHYDAALGHGKTEIWYWKPEMSRDIMMGLAWLQTQVPEAYPEPYNLGKTHIMLGRVKCKDLAHLFDIMQGEQWSPNGEARGLIKTLGLNHTSMSVGDIVVVDGSALFVDGMGWVKLGRVDKKE